MGWTLCIWKAVNCVSTVLARKGFGCMFFNTSISDMPLESIREQKRGVKFGCCVGSPPTCLLNLTKFISRLTINECHRDWCSELPSEYLKWSLLPQNLKCGLLWKRKNLLTAHTVPGGTALSYPCFMGRVLRWITCPFPWRTWSYFWALFQENCVSVHVIQGNCNSYPAVSGSPNSVSYYSSLLLQLWAQLL